MNIYQSLEWRRAKEEDGKEAILLTFEKDGKIKSKILAFKQGIKTPLGKKTILTAEGNPEVEDEDSALKILRQFKIESKKYFYGIIAPSVLSPLHNIFEKAGYKKVSDYTVLIDLKKSEEELWQNLEKKSARWGVKTGEKNGLKMKKIESLAELEEFYNIYKKTATDGKFKPKSVKFIAELIKNKDKAEMIIVKKDEKIICGGLVLLDVNYNILSLTAASEEGYKMQAMPFLYWNIILSSKNLGKKYLDLGGYSKEAKAGDKLYSVNKFKENFGGEIVEQPIYSTNWVYPFIRKAMRRFNIIKRMYYKI